MLSGGYPKLAALLSLRANGLLDGGYPNVAAFLLLRANGSGEGIVCCEPNARGEPTVRGELVEPR